MGSSNEPPWRAAINHMLHFSFVLKAEIETRLGSELGIGLADHEALTHIHLSDQERKMSDLADQLVLSRGGVTKLVDRLEESGLLHRQASADDRRVTIIGITAEGSATVARSRAIIDEILIKRWANRITDDEAMLIQELIRRGYHDENSTLVEE